MSMVEQAKPQNKLAQWIVPALFILMTVVVFITQSRGVGFWDTHHGWVSSHGLAIMSRAKPENLFVGYAMDLVNPDGTIRHVYFDRYPFFFSAFMGALISLTDNLAVKVFIARQVMNLIFIATAGVAYLLLWRLTKNTWLALTAVFLSVSSSLLIYYRDMIHYDQPALLGILLLLYVIATKIRGRWLYITTLIAVSIGRGYASFFVLGLWFLLEAAEILFNRTLTLNQRIRRIITHDALRAMVLGVAWASLFLGYNMMVESARRDVPIEQTSIFGSALRRLPSSADESGSPAAPIPSFMVFVTTTLNRIVRMFTPGEFPTREREVSPLIYPIIVFATVTVVLFIWRQNPEMRKWMALIAASGIVWIFFMANLTYHHNYTAMYALGFALIFYTAFLSWLQQFRRAIPVVLLISVALFVASNVQHQFEHSARKRALDVYTYDYNTILHSIDGSHRTIYDTYPEKCSTLPLNCQNYLLGFYLGNNYLSRRIDNANYVVTSEPYYLSPPFLRPDDDGEITLLSRSLTPQNNRFHIFDTTEIQYRPLPDDLSVMYTFGDVLSLQKWELRDSVQVQPCQRIPLESWWRLEAKSAVDYSMQIAMVNTDGEAISSVNRGLTQILTRTWEPDAYYLDVHEVTVPCDAPPGEYPLVMSVFDPGTVLNEGALPVKLSDGTPFNDYVYLTTLFVQ